MPETAQILLLDIKAEISGRNPALALEQALLRALQDFSPGIAEPARAYWKIPAWYECTVVLFPADRKSFDALVSPCRAGWYLTLPDEVGGDCEAIWTDASENSFLLPEVRWAHLLLVTPNPPPPDVVWLPQ